MRRMGNGSGEEGATMMGLASTESTCEWPQLSRQAALVVSAGGDVVVCQGPSAGSIDVNLPPQWGFLVLVDGHDCYTWLVRSAAVPVAADQAKSRDHAMV
jgi:hypothetical protein